MKLENPINSESSIHPLISISIELSKYYIIHIASHTQNQLFYNDDEIFTCVSF